MSKTWIRGCKTIRTSAGNTGKEVEVVCAGDAYREEQVGRRAVETEVQGEAVEDIRENGWIV